MRIKQDEVQHYESVIKRLKSSQVSEIGDKEKVIASLRQERDSLEKEITSLKGAVDKKDAKIKWMYVICGVFFLFAFAFGPFVGWIAFSDMKKKARKQEEKENG